MERNDGCSTFFSINRKKEEIYFNGTSYCVPIGSVSKYLIEVDDKFWNDTLSVAYQICEISDEKQVSSLIDAIKDFSNENFVVKFGHKINKAKKEKDLICLIEEMVSEEKDRFSKIRAYFAESTDQLNIIDTVDSVLKEWENHLSSLAVSTRYNVVENKGGRPSLFVMLDDIEKYDRFAIEGIMKKVPNEERISKILTSIKMAKKINEFDAPDLLKQLVVILPCCSKHAEIYRQERRVDFSNIEYKRNREIVFEGKGTTEEREQFRQEFTERSNILGPLQGGTYRWRRLADYLCSETFGEIVSEMKHWSDSSEMLTIVNEYGKLLAAVAIERKRLKKNLLIATGVEKQITPEIKANCRDELIYNIEAPARVNKEKSLETFPACTAQSNVYEVTSFSAMVSLEMQVFERYYLEFKTCSFCEGLFVPYSEKAVYCKYPNKKHENKTCQEVAPSINFVLKCSLRETYKKSYMTYKKWVDMCTSEDPTKRYDKVNEVFAYIMAASAKLEEKENSINEIKKDIKTRFKKWRENAKSMLDKCENGEIEDSECKKALKVPSIVERSPLLMDWRNTLLGR